MQFGGLGVSYHKNIPSQANPVSPVTVLLGYPLAHTSPTMAPKRPEKEINRGKTLPVAGFGEEEVPLPKTVRNHEQKQVLPCNVQCTPPC